ncbi:MAG TPA: group 1 truncated hemoglobin [Alphaproteobacteria bacterium]|jgi:hemoglobin
MKRLVSLALGAGMIVSLAACAGQEKPSFPGKPATTIDTRGHAPAAAAGPGPAAKPVDPNSLYARLGQRPAIEAVMTDFVNRMAKDRRVNKRFAKTDAKVFIAKLTDQLCEASGGPCKYAGKDMKTAHAGMKITNREWNITVGHIAGAMRAKKVPRREQREVLAVLGPMKGDIVGQ